LNSSGRCWPGQVILPYDTEEDAISMANASPYGLSGYVQSACLERAHRVAARLRTGMGRSTSRQLQQEHSAGEVIGLATSSSRSLEVLRVVA